jgi:dipeptidyl-peptidase 4
VHFQNSEILINALVAADKPFTMMEYPNRTHCICQGRNTQLHLFELITRYLDQNLRGAAPSTPSNRAAAAGW